MRYLMSLLIGLLSVSSVFCEDLKPKELEIFIDGVISGANRTNPMPAVAVSLASGDDILLTKSYGYADLNGNKKAMPSETLFRIGSVSKTFVWTAAVMLFDRGLLDLDVDVNQYLIGLSIPNTFDKPITFRHLMSHTAGFEETIEIFSISDGSNLSLLEALTRTIPDRVYPPGERVAYSNWGTALATLIIETITQEPFRIFLERELLSPLGIDAIGYRNFEYSDASLQASMAKGYAKGEAAFFSNGSLNVGPLWSIGSLSLTATDMAKWSQFHLNEGRVGNKVIISDDSYQLLRERVIDIDKQVPGMAHGFMSAYYKGLQIFGHGGATNNFLTMWLIVPEVDLGIFVSHSASYNSDISTHLPELILDHLTKSTAPPNPVVSEQQDHKGAPQTWTTDQYEGSYLTNRRAFNSILKLASLGGSVSVSPHSEHAIFVQFPSSASIFRSVENQADVFENANGQRVYFRRNEEGHVTHLIDSRGITSLDKVDAIQSPFGFNVVAGLVVFFSLTSLLGAWYRRQRNIAQSAIGKAIAPLSIVAPITVFVFFGTLLLSFAELSNISDLVDNLPSFGLQLLSMIGYLVACVALLMSVGLVFCWLKSGWTIWRKIHFSLFTVSYGLFIGQLIIWQVIF